MVDFEKLFIVDDVVPVDDEADARRVGEYCYKPGIIPLAEFDIGGVLYHANYFHLYERARESLLDSLGTPYHQLVKSGCHLAIVESEQYFHKPISYGTEIEVGLRCLELKSASLTFAYSFYSNEELVHEGITRHAFVKKDDSGAFKMSRLPRELKEAMSKRFTV